MLIGIPIAVVFSAPVPAWAQSMSPVVEGYANSYGGGVSGGVNLSVNAWLWGVSTDYTRTLTRDWLLNIALAYDRETAAQAQDDKITDTFSVTVAVGYAITERLVVGGGFGHGIIDRDNMRQDWKWVSNDLAVGGVASYSVWRNGIHDVSPSASLEYSIPEKKWSLSFDVGYAVSF